MVGREEGGEGEGLELGAVGFGRGLEGWEGVGVVGYWNSDWGLLLWGEMVEGRSEASGAVAEG